MSDTTTATASIFVIVEVPYDSYRIRAVCHTRAEADVLVQRHGPEAEFALYVHEIIPGQWKGLGYEDGWEEDA